MKASDLLVRALENEGVRMIFGVPGEENLDFVESLRTSSIRLVVTRHEQAAGFMAAVWGRLTGKAGVCLSTLGPGATNLTTATVYALLGGMPMVVLTGQKPIKKSKQGRFQIVDIVHMMGPLTKSSRQIVNANLVPALIREAFRVAEAEKPGPVHLELPEDVAQEEVDRIPFQVTEVAPPDASPGALTRARDLILHAQHPLVCIAAGANRQKTVGVLAEFLDSTGLYFVTTQMGKGAVDERHPRFLGTTALSEGDYVHEAIEHADVILMIGHDLSEKPPFLMALGGRTVIHMNHDEAGMDDVYFPQLEVLGCIASNARALADLIKGSDRWDFGFYEKVKDALETRVFGNSEAETFPLTPGRVVNEVRAALPSDGIVSLDNGIYKIWFAREYRAHMPNTLLLDNALASMGAGLPVAIGAKLVYPERQTLAVCGDGGFMMNSQELETAVRLGLDLCVLVLRDDAYGMIRWKQVADGFGDYAMGFGNPDFVRYAESYGATGHRVEAAGQLTGLIQEAEKSGGVHVIDVPMDYSDNQRVLIDELKNKQPIT